jgi:hypothetical protein
MTDSGLEHISIGTIVPQLKHHLPLTLPGPFGAKAEELWQMLGRKQPGLLGYQVIATARRRH